MEESYITIIGAGVVGLAIASRLSENFDDIIVIEKNEKFGQEISSRNSEVIHSGIYYPKNSLKTSLCIQGRRMLYDLCEKNKIPHKKIGKIIIAKNNDEVDDMEELFNNGIENEIEDLKIIDENEINRLEPNIKAKYAIYSPSTGIIDSHSLMSYFEKKARENGAIIGYGVEVIGIEKVNDGYKIRMQDADGETILLKSNIVINCAGLCSDKIAEMVGIDIKEKGYELKFCKGEYFKVADAKAKFVNGLVYPLPHITLKGLGVHATKDLGDGLKLGPSAFYVDTVDYSIDEEHKRYFYDSVKDFLPFVNIDDLSPGMAGIRPKLQDAQSKDFRDFVIKPEDDIGFDGFINLIGIESPGLTSVPAIAEFVFNVV